MLAVTKTRRERGVDILERPEPSGPGEGYVLLEVGACGVCGTDLHCYEWVEHAGVDEAAVVEPAGVALHAFELVEFKPGDSVAVVGPGPIGLLTAMVAGLAGAAQVVVLGLAADAERLEAARRMGCEMISLEEQDAAEATRALTAATVSTSCSMPAAGRAPSRRRPRPCGRAGRAGRSRRPRPSIRRPRS